MLSKKSELVLQWIKAHCGIPGKGWMDLSAIPPNIKLPRRKGNPETVQERSGGKQMGDTIQSTTA
uniref:RNase H type-1 domain-containing protein n=1 Tax=Arion vulgaris TaxID=1028688 RepID=A0A0B6ZG43_9EUPU